MLNSWEKGVYIIKYWTIILRSLTYFRTDFMLIYMKKLKNSQDSNFIGLWKDLTSWPLLFWYHITKWAELVDAFGPNFFSSLAQLCTREPFFNCGSEQTTRFPFITGEMTLQANFCRKQFLTIFAFPASMKKGILASLEVP